VSFCKNLLLSVTCLLLIFPPYSHSQMHGPDTPFQRDFDAAALAIRQGNFDNAKNLILKSAYLTINQVDWRGTTLLEISCGPTANLDFINFLLDNGADPFAVTYVATSYSPHGIATRFYNVLMACTHGTDGMLSSPMTNAQVQAFMLIFNRILHSKNFSAAALRKLSVNEGPVPSTEEPREYVLIGMVARHAPDDQSCSTMMKALLDAGVDPRPDKGPDNLSYNNPMPILTQSRHLAGCAAIVQKYIH
jgi:hypothetical protein